MKTEKAVNAEEVRVKITELEKMIEQCEQEMRQLQQEKGSKAIVRMITLPTSLYIKWMKLVANKLRSKISV